MGGFKSLVLVGFVMAAIAVNRSEAQIFGIGGNPNANNNNGGNKLSFNLFGVQITLYCTPDGNMFLGAPPFRGATVMLQCGNSEIIASTTTDSFGISYMLTNPTSLVPFLPVQSNCQLVVNTTLSSCNPSLSPVGFLQSPLGFVGTSLFGEHKIANYAPTGFTYNSTAL